MIQKNNERGECKESKINAEVDFFDDADIKLAQNSLDKSAAWGWGGPSVSGGDYYVR